MKALHNLGLLIENERIKKYTLDKQTWKIKSFVEGICDVKTYRYLKNGGILKRTEIYDKLFERLGLAYMDNSAIMAEITIKGRILFECFDQMDRDQYQEVLCPLLERLLSVRNIAPFHVYHHLVQSLYEHIKFGKIIDEEEFHEYLRIMEVFTYEFQCLLRNLMIEFAFHTNQVNEYYHLIPIVDENVSFLGLQEVFFLDYSGNKLEARELAIQLFERNKKEENINSLLYIYTYIQGLNILLSERKDQELMKEIANYLNHKSLFQRSLVDYYMNEAVMNLMSRSYAEAYDFAKKVLGHKSEHVDELYYRAIVLMNYINSFEFIEEVKYREEEPQYCEVPDFICFYRYFKMKSRGANYKELESFLVNEVAYFVREDLFFDYEVFTKEIKTCIKETKDYKILDVWMERTHQNKE